MVGAVTETYAAALQHDIADLPADAVRLGVVRRPTGWFRALVDENETALSPPEELLTECKQRQEDLQRRGLCDEEAHNAAWEAVDFADRYHRYLDDDEAAAEAVADLVDRVRGGETVAVVCFEGDNKRCHRRLLRERVENRIDGDG